ncbi:MAG: hypothetical protein JSU70_10210 [Phycisphaerales bacterium]|nr:MAG: hypothetical protein JSU70_10210 [Phycisphaerales bacterium]
MRHKIWALVRAGAEHRQVVLLLAVLAVAVSLPSLWHGWFLDDMTFRLRMLGSPEVSERLQELSVIFRDASKLSTAMSELYAFLGHKGHVQELIAQVAPWWMYPEIRASFWRPLASLSIWLDYQLFPNSGPLQHAHSILWFAAVVFALTVLYRRVMGPVWAAALAGLLYVLDESYYMPVAFMANRNTLMALFFGMVAVLMHDRWRQLKQAKYAVAPVLFLALSLLSAEAGIATLAYLAAYALALDRDGWRKRIMSLVPYLVLIVIWRVVYGSLGYGAYGSGMYIDPGSEPLRFAAAMLERLPVLLFGQLVGPSADMYYCFNHSVRFKILLSAAGLLTLWLIVLLPLLVKDRLLLFWLLGMVFATVPICACMASSRNLMFVGVGAMGLVAQFVAGLIRKDALPKWRLWSASAWACCAVLLLANLLGGVFGRILIPKYYRGFMRLAEATFRMDLPEEVEKQDLIVVNAPVPLFLAGLPAVSVLEGRPVPRSLRALAPAFSPLEVVRTEDRAITLRARSGSILFSEQRDDVIGHWVYFLEEFNAALRDASHPLQTGQRIDVGSLSVAIKRLDEANQPTEVAFRFSVSLDDPSLRWVQWDWQKGYIPFNVPAVGEISYVPGPF